MQITEHFSIEDCEHSDYAIEHHIENHIPQNLMANGVRLCIFMETVRTFLSDYYGYEVMICPSSIYRCPQLNDAVKGKATSQHMRFEAMDWHPVSKTLKIPMDIYKVFKLIKNSKLFYDQLILEHDNSGNVWIHTSVPDPGIAARREALILAK